MPSGMAPARTPEIGLSGRTADRSEARYAPAGSKRSRTAASEKGNAQEMNFQASMRPTPRPRKAAAGRSSSSSTSSTARRQDPLRVAARVIGIRIAPACAAASRCRACRSGRTPGPGCTERRPAPGLGRTSAAVRISARSSSTPSPVTAEVSTTGHPVVADRRPTSTDMPASRSRSAQLTATTIGIPYGSRERVSER